MEKKKTKQEQNISSAKIRNRTITAFVIFILLFAGAIFTFVTIKNQPGETQKTGVQDPLRKVLNGNERVFTKIFSANHLAKTYPKSAAVKKVRVNGDVGMGKDFDAKDWKLKLVKAAGDTLLISLEDIRKLPKTEIIFDFKCIEGWSQITDWSGVKFSDFVKAYHLDQQSQKKYIGLVTPDGGYYVGIDMPSAMHPQTLLCYEMNGKPLPMDQGYPLRLIIPTKYGIKSLKRIGTLSFSDERPKDYWFERGYDYYSGL
ncbi:molybdopterin-dependent oxidoreductase [Chryseobacterium gotjawalense]|uniref:Molybdopterin-dependent oxidoreductase n=1 Tax=Chryseobacterium gotjawalense TaxID=3042315 RepID=A0ABY8REM7_9FLAO|nr:molybdopterin-dependent oxidoreductase [Chryseobacterium sp. wdc7]WHF52425.1 molybdopterin-dependent oxidoreductase [Chryseobacterium sp. wdc7]